MSTDLTAFPRGVSDPLCPDEHVIDTTTDHRLLWHIEGVLAVNARWDSPLGELQRDLRRYLNTSCQHHWHDYEAGGDIPAHRQCLWCNDVIWLEEKR